MYNRILFMGSKAQGLKLLKLIYNKYPKKLVGCVTIDDKKDSRSCIEKFKSFCSEEDIDIYVLTGKCDVTYAILKLHPDIVFVTGWYNLIPEKIIAKVKGGFIGVHNSLLPRYRGFSPLVWAMINGDETVGFSVFSFDTGMDTGKIWGQKQISVRDSDTISSVLEKIEKEVDLFFEENLDKMIEGVIVPSEQIQSGISYCARRVPNDGKICWENDNIKIYNFIRAQSKPYPGAFTILKDKKLIIWRAELFEYKIFGDCGQIAIIDNENDKIIISCGDNTGIVVCKKDMELENDIDAKIKFSLNDKFE